MARLEAILKFQELPAKIFKIMFANKSQPENGIPEQILQKVGLQVWDPGVPGKAMTAQPVQIHLKPGTAYPHRKQYPIKQEAVEGLQPITEKVVTYWLLVPCQSLCNTPILPILKSTGEYRLVQNLRLVNEAVVPL